MNSGKINEPVRMKTIILINSGDGTKENNKYERCFFYINTHQSIIGFNFKLKTFEIDCKE